MKRMLWITLLTLLAGVPAAAQTGFTQVSGTVVDVNGSVYSNAVFNVGFVNPGTPPGVQPLLNGFTFQQQYTGVVTDSFGRFSIAIPDNNAIAISGALNTQWNFSFCSTVYAATNQKYCFNLTLTITGASMNISSQLTAAAAILPISGGGGTISGSAAATQIAVGSGVNSIAGYPEFVYSHGLLDLNVPAINGIIQINGSSGFPYACSATGLQAGITAAGAQGVVDARGCNPGSTPSTSTITIPANVSVYLGPYTWVCGVANAPCWSITGSGAKLIGYYAGSQDIAAASQTATILRMGSGITSTTDMISINPAAVAGNIASVEVGWLTIDFANLTNTVIGRYGLAGDSVNRSKIHDLMIFNSGSDGVHFQTNTSTHSYENTLDTVYVRVSVGGSGFTWSTATTAGSFDFDRWQINNCSYEGYNLGSTGPGQGLGANGFLLTTGSSAVQQGIADFNFNNVWVGGVVAGGNGILVNQAGTAYINRIRINGEIEDTANANSGTGINFVNGGGTTMGHTYIQMVDISALFTNWATLTNLSSTVVTGYSLRQDGVHLVQTDGLQFLPGALPGSTTFNPTGGLVWQSGSNGSYLWYLTSDGIIHVGRTDTGPTELWRFDQGNSRFEPAADNTGSLGQASNRWASMSMVQLNIASVASLTTTAATSDNVTVTGATSSSHCSLTATNASAATNLATTYISAKTTNQVTVTHTATSGMTYDIVCTGD